jgi:hypothetical protein
MLRFYQDDEFSRSLTQVYKFDLGLQRKDPQSRAAMEKQFEEQALFLFERSTQSHGKRRLYEDF